MNIPTHEEMQAYFSKAKEVKCLSLNIKVDVSTVKNFTFNEAEKSWNSISGVIVFWKDGQYAEITKKKCDKGCADCKPCKDKLKNQ